VQTFFSNQEAKMRNRINRRKFLLIGSATLASTIVLRKPLFRGKPANAAGVFKVRLVNPGKNLDQTINVGHLEKLLRHLILA